MDDFPLLIELVSGTSIYREPETVSLLPIVQNGPPGAFVIFADGRKPAPARIDVEGRSGRAAISERTPLSQAWCCGAWTAVDRPER